MKLRIQPSTIEGELEVPGDKSIAHRALMLAALATGVSNITNLPDGQDVHSTASCLRLLGVEIEIAAGDATVTSSGSLTAPRSTLDAGNSGTTMRLLTGILAAQPFPSHLTGDESLCRRPMKRIIDPLTQMGADIASADGRAPLSIRGRSLQGIHYRLAIASAQVKSAILLAGLTAEGETVVEEPLRSRDHTERMLRALGVEVRQAHCTISLTGGASLPPMRLRVPGDISSAAFFLAAGTLTGGTVAVRNVGINPTRTGFLHVLERMGAVVEITEERVEGGEPLGTVRIMGRTSSAIEIGADDLPLLVDEVPLVVLLATQANGVSTIRGAGELRLKETDRIATVACSLRSLGADIDEFPDGFVVRGPTPLIGGCVSSFGDHRMAMMLAIAGCVAAGDTTIEAAEAAAVSYPRFDRDLALMGGRVGD